MVGIIDNDKLNEQQVKIRNEIGKHHWDLFVTLNFHRHVSIEAGHKLIREWDSRVSRKLNGRRYTKPQNQSKRMKFIGCLSYGEGRRGSSRITPKSTPFWSSNRLEDKRPLHSHLLVDLPYRVEIDRFIDVCEESLGRVLNKSHFEVYRDGMCHVSLNDKDYFDLQDVFQITDYIFQPRHIEVDDTGMFDTNNVVISSNYSLK